MPGQDTQNKAFAAIVARSWEDPDFRSKLLADPTATLNANGFHVPAGKSVVMVEEDSDTVVHMSLPQRPTELSDEQLDAVSGGIFVFTCSCFAWSDEE
ncbi:NHLP leader peptide family RiPP precursor [Rathayibacter soli]|uniref:NHLP leader peptide family RiPP precursor n=1 Tax=Rathayibacter soli TaxID=3144168 RepID=UPI0027E4215C|nr:NHLP leader peptide family RiPP precursor [Glaciibacter superstes]